MKSVFIFNHKNDIVFVNNDKSFAMHVKSCSAAEGLFETTTDKDEELDPNIILQLYSPLVASQRFMTGQAKNPYNKIKTTNGFVIVLKEFSDYVFVAINGDKEEDETFMHRKLLVLHRIITFLHGPCIEEIRPDKNKERVRRWKIIGHFLQTWCDLYHTEQSVLVEAVERLHVNQMLNSLSIGLLESALNRMKLSGEKHATHAMLIVNSKLLSLYSVRNATLLSTSDQLMMILLANKLFASDDTSTSHLCPLSSRETKGRKLSSASGPVKIGASSSVLQVHRGNQFSKTHDESSSDLDDNQLPSDEKATDSSDEAKSKSFVKDGFISKGKNESFPNLSDTQSSLSMGKYPILDSGRVTSLHRNTSGESPSNVITRSSSQSKCLMAPSSHLIGQSISPSSNINQSFSSQSNVLVSNVTAASNQTAEDFNSNSLPHTASALRIAKDATYKPRTAGLDVRHRTKSSISFNKESSKALNFINSMQSLPVIPHRDSFVVLDREDCYSLPDEGLKPTKSQSELSYNTQGSDEELTGYHKLTVMLRKGDVENVPHMVYSVRVLQGIYLMIVCERTKVQYAHVINQTASAIHGVMSSKPLRKDLTAKQIQDFVDTNIKKLGDLLKKSKGHTYVERLIVDIANKWESAKLENFTQHYNPKSLSHFPAKLESALSSMVEKLHELFRLLYLSEKKFTQEDLLRLFEGIKDVHTSIQKKLLDYKEYISIKSQRNVAMTMYYNDFPGMVHFIFINRSTNHVIASSFSEHVYEQESEHAMHVHVQKQVWIMYERMRQKLAAGYTTVTLREGGFHYSYFLWFEDSQGGFTIAPQQYYTGLRPSDNVLPGVLTFNFYTWLQKVMFPRFEKKTMQCYEMLVVHVGLVTTQYALSHCRKLAAKLWESSGESSTSVSLL